MIYCKKKELSKYMGLSARLDGAIRAIMECDLRSLSMGRNELTADVFGNRFDYVTQPEEKMLYETHVINIDIHLILSGEELILCADQAAMTVVEEKPDKDYIGSRGPWDSCMKMTSDDVLIVFPGEAHKAKCMVDQEQTIEKFVVKVPMV